MKDKIYEALFNIIKLVAVVTLIPVAGVVVVWWWMQVVIWFFPEMG